MNSSHQIRLGATISYATIVFNVISGLVFTPWIVHHIGKSDYGLYALVGSFVAFFLMDFGLGQAIARFIAKYRAEGDEAKVGQLLGLVAKLYLVITVVLLLALGTVFFLIQNVFVALTVQEIARFKVVYCIAGVFALLSFPLTPLNGILIAYERFVFLKLCDLLNKIAFVIFVAVALLLGYGLYSLVTINVAIAFAIALSKLVYVQRVTSLSFGRRPDNRRLFKELATFSGWVAVMLLAQRLLTTLAPTILGIFSGTGEIAVLSVGMVIEGYTWTFANALNGLFLAKVSVISLQHDSSNEITNLMIRVGRIQLFLVGLLFIGFLTMGKRFISLWMGPDFQESYYVALLLIIPGAITLTQEIAQTFILVTNQVKYRALLLVGASVLSTVLALLLAPTLGAVGSALSICISLFTFSVLALNFFYWKVLKLDILRFFKVCYGTMLAPIGLSLLAGFLIDNYMPAVSMFAFVPGAALLAAIYVATMWLWGLNSEEKQLIRSLFLRLVPLVGEAR